MEITKTLLENLDHLGAWGILTTDAELRIVGWNRWLEKHSGKPAGEMIGRDLLEAYPDLIDRGLDRYYRQALSGQAAILSQRFHRHLLPLPPTVADPNFMHMQQTARISPVMNGGIVVGTFTLIEDVTERVLIEQELRRQAERLEEANRHKDEFLAMLAHELRNPLAPIRNGVQLLELVPTDGPEARHAREMIERQVAHMSRLIDDLLDVSRIVRGKVRLQKTACDLTLLLRRLAEDFRPILADNGLEFLVELPAEPCWMEGDDTRLSQIVSNLLHNAGKFTNRGGRVRLAAEIRREGTEAVITVADDGIGMSPETLSRIFDAFSQAETSLARSKGGLGLGLALVKGLVELHDGRVEARSDGPARGSTFIVRIPLKPMSPADRAPAPAQETEPGPRKRILIIEDNRDTAVTMKVLIEHLGFQVDVAFTGREGVEAARRLLPDVVLCDIGLPELDGYEIARALRTDAATRNAYLIAQSGYGQADDVRKAREAGFDLHLIKPVHFEDLKRILYS